MLIRTPQRVSRVPVAVPIVTQVVTDVAPEAIAVEVTSTLITVMVVAVYVDTVAGTHITASKSVQPTGSHAAHAVGVDTLPLFVDRVNTLMLLTLSKRKRHTFWVLSMLLTQNQTGTYTTLNICNKS